MDDRVKNINLFIFEFQNNIFFKQFALKKSSNKILLDGTIFFKNIKNILELYSIIFIKLAI